MTAEITSCIFARLDAPHATLCLLHLSALCIFSAVDSSNIANLVVFALRCLVHGAYACTILKTPTKRSALRTALAIIRLLDVTSCVVYVCLLFRASSTSIGCAVAMTVHLFHRKKTSCVLGTVTLVLCFVGLSWTVMQPLLAKYVWDGIMTWGISNNGALEETNALFGLSAILAFHDVRRIKRDAAATSSQVYCAPRPNAVVVVEPALNSTPPWPSPANSTSTSLSVKAVCSSDTPTPATAVSPVVSFQTQQFDVDLVTGESIARQPSGLSSQPSSGDTPQPPRQRLHHHSSALCHAGSWQARGKLNRLDITPSMRVPHEAVMVTFRHTDPWKRGA
eukprot:PhM_4_TR18729/c0_g1_i1/m.73766